MTDEGVLTEFDEAISALTLAKEQQSDALLRMGGFLADRLHTGHKLLICGNGGSAADSQHMAAELVSSFMMGLRRPGLPAIALTTDSSILTAFSNDFGYEGVFARQVQALGEQGDCLLAISTSGRSRSVLKAVEEAGSQGLATAALTGAAPNPLADTVDFSVTIPSFDTQAIQAAHLVAEHVLCRIIESRWSKT